MRSQCLSATPALKHEVTQEYGVDNMQTAPTDIAALLNTRWSGSQCTALTRADLDIVSAATHALHQLQTRAVSSPATNKIRERKRESVREILLSNIDIDCAAPQWAVGAQQGHHTLEQDV